MSINTEGSGMNNAENNFVDFFVKSFCKRDLELISKVLNQKGNFNGYNWQTFTADLEKLFNGLSCVVFSVQTYEGMSIDPFPGAYVVEIHIKIEQGNTLQTFYVDDYFGKERGHGFLVLKYGILSDKEEGITKLFIPKKSISLEEVNRRKKEN
jgi:hypothetical protein